MIDPLKIELERVNCTPVVSDKGYEGSFFAPLSHQADVVKRRLQEENEKEIEETEDEEKITTTIIQRVRPITTETFKLGPFHFYKGEIHIIDRICRFLFPFLFLVFNFTFFIFHRLEDESVL